MSQVTSVTLSVVKHTAVHYVTARTLTDDGDAHVTVEIERLLGDLYDLVGGEQRLVSRRQS